MTRGLTIVVALCCFVLTTLACGSAFAGKRVALVIGNSHYDDRRLFLPNPVNDAQDVGAALQDLGFAVTTSTDLTVDAFGETVSNFKTAAQDAEIAIFFYAGHAVQSEKVNYFIPTDAKIVRPDQLRHAAISLDDVQDAFKGVSGVQVMILDSCRDDPFNMKLATRGIREARGLEFIQPGGNGDSIILYSTRPNEVALDGGNTRNSPFSSVLVEQLRQPAKQELVTMLRTVAAEVIHKTDKQQTPEITMSGSGLYYLEPANDRMAWEAIKNTLDPSVLRDFGRRFPDSIFRSEAERRADVFEREEKRRQDEEKEAARKKEDDRQAMVCGVAGQRLDVMLKGRDLEGLERLGRETACPGLKEAIGQALRVVADATRQAKCDRLDQALGQATQAGNVGDLNALRSDDGACPGLGDRIEKAVAQIRRDQERERMAAEQRRVCDVEQASLDALRVGQRADRIAAIAQIGASAKCDAVRGAAMALAGELRTAASKALREAAQQAVCAAEIKALDTLVGKGPRTGIEAMGRSHQCPSLDVGQALARFDDMIERRRQEALAACVAADVGAFQSSGDLKGLAELLARCPSRSDDIGAARAAVEAGTRLAEACRREGSELQGYVGTGRQSAVDALRKRATCPTLDFSAAALTIAKAACDADLAVVGRASGSDDAALHALAENGRLCPDARTQAARRLNALVVVRQAEDQACDGAVAQAAQLGDVARLQHLSGEARCDRRKAVITAATEVLRAAESARVADTKCDADAVALQKIGVGDEAALRAFSTNARVCERARQASNTLLSDLLASRDRDDGACDAAAGNALAHRNVGDLRRLQDDQRCSRRRSALVTRLATLQADERTRIVAVQRKLTQVGCYSGAASGTVDAATVKALTAYWTVKHADQPAPSTISLDVSSELDGQAGLVCIPAQSDHVAKAEPEDKAATETMQKAVKPAVRPAALDHAKPGRPPIKEAAPKQPIQRRPIQAPLLRLARPRAPEIRPAPPQVAEPAPVNAGPKAHIFY